MRLDEWQKYIGSQFLDDEPEATPPPKTEGQAVPPALPALVNSETLSSDKAESAPIQQEVRTRNGQDSAPPPPAPDKAEARILETSDAGARPETTPNAIQNVVTMVVSPTVLPEQLPSIPRPPRIELLTPLPDQTINQTLIPSAAEPVPEVNNRTRRRSHSVPPAYASEAASSSPENGTGVTPAATDSPAERGLFDPIQGLDADIPSFGQYLPSSHSASSHHTDAVTPVTAPVEEPAPFLPPSQLALSEIETPQEGTNSPRLPRSRARHARNVRPENVPSGLSAAELWAAVPRHVQTLLSLERMEQEQEVAQFSYKRPFQEKRHELIERLLDPILSLEDTARLLNVCPTTVRRYTNKGILTYYRKEPERTARIVGDNNPSGDKETRQRRFRLSDILAFLETQQAALAADRQAERRSGLADADFAEADGKDD